MNEPATLEVHDLRKQYPTPAEPLVVLAGVSLSLRAGDAVAIIGPSGSGKSTLLNILGTLDEPSSGTVRLAGVDPFSLSANELARFRSERVGFVFQEHHLLPQCMALENILVARLASRKVDKTAVDRARDLLRQVGLEARASHLPAELSGGERQRVAVARALMNQPALLLCDEPTGSLDAHTGQAVADTIFAMAAQTNVILVAVTHSLELAARFARRMRMQDGTLQDELEAERMRR
jgi:lipoprotein-releasing system ATP-binding protein